jgi:predicted nuclease with TOPRIM domain
VDLLERDLALRWRIGQTVAESEQVTERIERLRDPSMTNEDPSVIPGGLEGLRSRLEDERSRLAEESVRLNSQRAEMERRLMQLEPPPPSPATGCAQDVWTLLDEAITRGLAEPIPQR